MKLRIFIIVVSGLVLYTLIITGLTRVVYDNPNQGKDKIGNTLSSIIYNTSEASRKVKSYFSKPKFLIRNTTLKDGFQYYSKDIENYPKLLVSFKTKPFESKIQLLDIPNGRIIREWNPDSKEITRRSYNPDNPNTFSKGADINYEHPVLLKDSSIVFSTGYSTVRIDAKSAIVWVNNTINAHHSVELNSKGNIYVPGNAAQASKHKFLPENFEEYATNLKDDLIVELDVETGKVISSKSVLSILEENGLEYLAYQNGTMITDPIHLNDIQPALSDGLFWAKDDLLLSCRNLSTLFIYRPSTNKIVWFKKGPWYAQHDPHFLETDKIVVFGNDVILNYAKNRIFKNSYHFINDTNEIYVYDFTTDSVSKPYTMLLQKEKIKTPTQGNCTILANGDIFVEETDRGRIIFGDTLNKKIEFARRINEEYITALNWSRIIN